MGGETIASVRLVHRRVVLPASRLLRPGERPEFRARLSPDGKHILFPQEVKGHDLTYRLILHDIETRRETEIPLDLPRGYETVFTRFNFFNPAGDKLALFSMKQHPNPTVTEVVIYNIPSSKLTATNITGNEAMAQFDCTGKRLLVSRHNSYVAMASLDDYSIGKPLESGWVHSCSPYSPYATVFQPPDPLRRRIGFKLFNLELQTALELPVHEGNRALDDVIDQWSSDGKYLFYVDVQPREGGGQRLVNRVWDLDEKREKALVHNVICLGPGPASNLMLMASTEEADQGSVRVYDIRSGSLSGVGDKSMKAIHAWGGRILYVATENGTESIYVADVVDNAGGN